MKTYKKLRLFCILLLTVLLSCACGQTTPSTDSTNEQTDTTTNASISPSITASPIDESNPDISQTFVMTDTPLEVEKYLPIKFTDAPENYTSMVLYTDTFGSQLYMLADYLFESDQHAFRLYRYDTDTRELEPLEFAMNQEDWTYFTIMSMDVLDESSLSFKINCLKKGFQKYEELLYQTDLNGKCINMQDPFPTEEDFPWNNEYSGLRTFTFPGGDTYVTKWNNIDSVSTISAYNKDTKKYTKVADIPNHFISALTTDREGNLYFVGSGYLTLYHPTEKTGIRLCSLADCGISVYGDVYLVMNQDKELAIVSQNAENPGIYFLKEKQPTTSASSDTIRLTRLVPYGMEYVSKAAASLTNTSDTISIEVEKLGDSFYSDTQMQEAFHDRIMMEIVSGGGPELLWVSQEDMNTLAQKGALMDLEPLLPEEVKEQLLPGLLDLRVNGTLVATSPEISFHTMIVSDEYWQADSWTTDDFLTIADSNPEWSEPVLYSINKVGYYFILYGVLLQHYDEFIDFENKTCDFENETFLRMLEFCKKYGVPSNTERTWDEVYQALENGEGFSQMKYFYNGFTEFSHYMVQQGDYSHIVGYPTPNGSENYFYSEGYLVVNANATHIEEIKEFLAYLLSYEKQYTTSWTPVRKDVLRDRVGKNPYTGKPQLLLDVNGNLVTGIETKPDGTTWIEEFISFAEGAIPEPTKPSAIGTILGDELPSYFEGSKSAEETAKIIQNRVQLYLDESK